MRRTKKCDADMSISEIAEDLAGATVKSLERSGRKSVVSMGADALEEKPCRQQAGRRERERVRRQAKRTTEVWAMPMGEVPTHEKGKYNTFFEVVEGYRKALDEFKRDGCELGRINGFANVVKDKTSSWIRRVHPEYVQFFFFQYCEGCRDAMIERTETDADKEHLRLLWKKLLTPRVHPPWLRPLGAPMPRWPKRR